MKLLKKISLLMCAIMLSFAAVSEVSAANYTPVAGTSTTLHKYFAVASDAEVPAADFNFSIAAGTAVEATATTAKVWAGLNPAAVTLNGDAGSTTVSFAAGAATTAGTATDGIVNDASLKYANQNLVVSFAGVSYPEPGIYRYILTEAAQSNSAISNDPVPTRTIDVEVIDNNGALEVAAIVVYNGTITAGPATSGTAAGTKTDKYLNTYASHNLTVSKAVTGAGGSVDQYFKFTVTIGNAGNGTVMTLDMSNAETATHANNATSYTTTVMNTANTKDDDGTKAGQQIVAAADGTASFDIYMHSGQSFVLKGLPEGATYKVEEAESGTLGYTTTGEVKTATAMTGANANVAITNARAWTPQTGLNRYYRNAMIIVGLSAVGIALLIVANSKKRKNELN